MDNDPEEYASHILKYTDEYLQKRQELCAVIAGHNHRIERMFLFDRCMNGAIMLASFGMLCSIGVGNRMIAIFCGFVILSMSVAPIVAGIRSRLDIIFAMRRESKRQLEIMNEAWRQWSTS